MRCAAVGRALVVLASVVEIRDPGVNPLKVSDGPRCCVYVCRLRQLAPHKRIVLASLLLLLHLVQLHIVVAVIVLLSVLYGTVVRGWLALALCRYTHVEERGLWVGDLVTHAAILMLPVACKLVIVGWNCRSGRGVQILRIGRLSACVVTICCSVLILLIHVIGWSILVAAVEHVRPVNNRVLSSILFVVILGGGVTACYSIVDPSCPVDTVVDVGPRGGCLVDETI